MMNNININQLNKIREKLISYEHKRNQLKGLDDLNAGLDILSEYIEGIDIAECNVTAKNLLITYRRNSFEWIKETLENCSGDESELSTLVYIRKLMKTFEDANEVIDPGIEFNHLKQLIRERFVKYLLGPAGICIPDISFVHNFSIEEQELLISLFEKNPNIFISA